MKPDKQGILKVLITCIHAQQNKCYISFLRSSHAEYKVEYDHLSSSDRQGRLQCLERELKEIAWIDRLPRSGKDFLRLTRASVGPIVQRNLFTWRCNQGLLRAFLVRGFPWSRSGVWCTSYTTYRSDFMSTEPRLFQSSHILNIHHPQRQNMCNCKSNLEDLVKAYPRTPDDFISSATEYVAATYPRGLM